jgi:hypothetical protein
LLRVSTNDIAKDFTELKTEAGLGINQCPLDLDVYELTVEMCLNIQIAQDFAHASYDL